MKIDTSNWKEFRIGDLFEKLNLKCLKKDFNKAMDVSEKPTKEFDLPLVNAKHGNNGIMYYGRSEDWESAEMTIDIVSDGAASTGDVYAQPQRTGVLYNAYLIKPLWNCTSENVLLYIACVMEKCIKQHFGYDNKCTWDKVKERPIYLPATQTGEPDWDYMENYMTKIMEQTEKKLDTLKKTENIKRHVIDTSQWGDFKIGELFELSLSKDDIQPKNITEGDIPLVSSGKTNNGIIAYIKDDNATLQKAGTITVDMFGKAFYQGQPYYAVSHGRINILTPKHKITENQALFLVTIIEKVASEKYAFDEMCTGTKLSKDTIKLPVTPTGEPDWQYMESYMAKVMKQCDETIERFKKLKAESE